jgi:hypothetical protein
MENITIRLAPGFAWIVFGCATDPAASSDKTMPRLAVNRKDTGGESSGGKVPEQPSN